MFFGIKDDPIGPLFVERGNKKLLSRPARLSNATTPEDCSTLVAVYEEGFVGEALCFMRDINVRHLENLLRLAHLHDATTNGKLRRSFLRCYRLDKEMDEPLLESLEAHGLQHLLN